MTSYSLLLVRLDEFEQDLDNLQKDIDHLKNIIKMNSQKWDEQIDPEDLCQNFIGESGNDNH